MKAILQKWNFIRLLRLVLGIAILAQGIYHMDTLTIILGAAFSGMAVANVGCCGTSGCAVNSTRVPKTKNIQYEELDIKK